MGERPKECGLPLLGGGAMTGVKIPEDDERSQPGGQAEMQGQPVRKSPTPLAPQARLASGLAE